MEVLSRRLVEARQQMMDAILASPERFFPVMQEGLTQRGIQSLPATPQPYFLPRTCRASIQALGEHFAQALELICQEAFDKGTKHSLPLMHHRSREWLSAGDEALHPFLFCARFDGLLDEETGAFTLLECNAGDPSGEGLTDAVLDIILDAGFLDVLGEEGYIYDRLIDAHHTLTQGLPQTNALAVGGDWVRLTNTDSFIHEDHRLFATRYEALGQPLKLIDPRTCVYDGYRLSHEGRPIEVVLRDTIDELLLPPFWPGSKPVLDAYAKGDVLMFNPLKTILGDDKTLLESLSLASDHPGLSAACQDTLRRSMPWTRVLREGQTTYQGASVELLPFLRQQREKMVLKPVQGYGGFGVVIGPETSPASWEQAIKDAMATPGSTIAQAFSPIPLTPFVTEQPDGTVQIQSKKVTLSFWVHQLRFVGCFARTSDDTVINVHQGGALLPLVYV